MGSNVFHTSDLGTCSIDRMFCSGAMISVRDSVIVSASIAGIQMKRGKEGFLTGRIKARERGEDAGLEGRPFAESPSSVLAF